MKQVAFVTILLETSLAVYADRDQGDSTTHTLDNFSPYARTYQFPVYYPSYRNPEEEEALKEHQV